MLKGAAAAGASPRSVPFCPPAAAPAARPQRSPAAAAAPKKGGHIRSAIGGGSAKDTLDGQTATSEAQIGTQWQLYDALLGWDPNHKL